MSKRILIVEDEKNIVDILTFNLNREGYDVRHESTVSWFDNDRVVISAVEEDGSQLMSLYRFVN